MKVRAIARLDAVEIRERLTHLPEWALACLRLRFDTVDGSGEVLEFDDGRTRDRPLVGDYMVRMSDGSVVLKSKANFVREFEIVEAT